MRSRSMKAVVGGFTQRNATTVATVTTTHATSASTTARTSRARRPLRRLATGRGGRAGADRPSGAGRDPAGALHLDGRDRHVLVAGLVAGLHGRHLVHHVHALDDVAEHGVTG